MKRTFWKTALCCGLALSLSSVGLFAGGLAVADKNSHADRGKGKDKDKGKPKTRQDARPPTGDTARAQPSQGRNAPHSGGRGGIHAPAIAGPRRSSGGDRQQPSINRTPTLSRPIIGGSQDLRQPRSVPQQRQGSRPIREQTHDGGFSGAIRHGYQGLRGNAGFEDGTRRSPSNHSGIVNLPFVGNTVDFSNRRLNVGHSSYQPAYYRHSGYHGYWNGNRGFGGDSGYRDGSRSGIGLSLGNGSGFDISIGSNRGGGFGSAIGIGRGYGTGWGWGLGNSYRYGGYGSGYGGYGYRPFGWGLGGWGLGSLIYDSGYLGYTNPYYSNRYGSLGNYYYSQPIPVSYNTSVSYVQNDPNSADEVLNNAVAAFQQNDYDAALDIVNKGITLYPDDAVLHEFRSLVLFARQDYQQAASTIHAVLAVGPGWDWTTLSSMYTSVTIYTEQLRALEAFREANPQDAASRFLLAYHYMSCGHTDAAARQLQKVVKLMPKDRVAADLLKMIEAPQPSQSGDTPSEPGPQSSQTSSRPAVQPIDPAMLVGTWKAARADGSKFNLTLTNDEKFTWSFAQKDQAPQEFGGTYSVEGNVLALERTGGGSLIAEVTPGGEGKFNFRMLGAPDEDPGLDFSR